MTMQVIKCKNKSCINRMNVRLDNPDSKPILFCSDLCLNSFEDEKINSTLKYQGSK